MFKRIALLSSLELFFLLTTAQVPLLKITDGTDSCVSLKKLRIEVRVSGNIATTSMEMTFYNSTHRILEGSLTFPLPQGVTVSGYALDIAGKLRDAVPVEKEKATQVFESIERRRVDPGLLEKVEGNNFRTRIYPLPPNGSRTVRISYDEVLQTGFANTLRYSLPLTYTAVIPDFHLDLTVLQASIAPVIEERPGEISFKEWNRNYSAALDKKNFTPSGSLRFAIPKNPDAPEVIMQKINNDYYFIANTVINQPSRKRIASKKIGLIWDASISGLKRNKAAEIDLLDNYFEENPNCTVELATISNSFEKKGSFTIINGNWNSLHKILESVIYDGATNLSAVNLPSIPCSEYLFFSDGMSTFSTNSFPLTGKQVFTINSSLQFDYNTLQLIARISGAQFINLTAQTSTDALKSLTEEPFKFIRIKNSSDVSEVYPSYPVAINNSNFFVTGIVASPAESIILQFGYGNTVTMEKTIRLNYGKQQITQINLQRFWAQQKIAELDLQYEKYKDDISFLGRQYSIVTRNTSLMVLETVEDYVRYKIETPLELRKEYYALLKQRRTEEMEEEIKPYDIHSSFKHLFEWWSPATQKKITRFTPPKVETDSEVGSGNNSGKPGAATSAIPRQEEKKEFLTEVVVTAQGVQTRKDITGSVSTIKSDDISYQLQGKVSGLQVTNNAMQEVVVIGYAAAKKIADPAIIVADWTPNRPYLTAIEMEPPSNYYGKYIELRKGFIYTPAFYFDMAGFFFRKKDKATAIKILSNIAELNIEDHELYAMLGFKLKEAGDYNNALFIFKKILGWRPHEPQSYRHFALALADAGKWQQAANILYTGLTKDYAEDIIDNYDGIQEVMIMELNNLLTKHKDRIKTGRYNKKIIAAMPVDIRVVLNWNRNDTDIDLWMTDPKGEKCFFGNTKTTNGALISSDMIDGYGPEQLMVKKALKGKYKIQVHYYGDDQVKLTGPSTIMVEIFTRYNSGKEERKIITMQMENDEENEGIFVGEFNFE